MKQVVFLVTIQVNKDGSNSISATDIKNYLQNRGLQGVEVSDGADYSEIEMRSFQVVPENPEYFRQTKISMTKSDDDVWSKTISTSSVLYAEGK